MFLNRTNVKSLDVAQVTLSLKSPSQGVILRVDHEIRIPLGKRGGESVICHWIVLENVF